MKRDRGSDEMPKGNRSKIGAAVKPKGVFSRIEKAAGDKRVIIRHTNPENLEK